MKKISGAVGVPVLGLGAAMAAGAGFAAQIGADYAFDSPWSMNVDLKYIDMNTRVHVSDTVMGTLDFNPWVASVGIGYRF